MRDPVDVSMTKLARTILLKKGVDMTGADLRVLHGVIYLKGSITINKGENPTLPLRKLVEEAGHYLRNKPGVKDFIVDVQYRE